MSKKQPKACEKCLEYKQVLDNLLTIIESQRTISNGEYRALSALDAIEAYIEHYKRNEQR